MFGITELLEGLDIEEQTRALKYIVAKTLGWSWVRFTRVKSTMVETPTGEYA